MKKFEEKEDKSLITELDLSYKNLTKLPDLSEYSNLEELYCEDNKLTSLPKLPKTLEYLDCADNQLTTLPELPKSLKNLYCNNNQLSYLPELPELPETLIHLHCYYNQLTSLPKLSKTLLGLYCYDNQLTSLPELPKTLRTLNCSYNQLTLLPELPETLEYLYCYNNKLTSLTELPKTLKYLDCSNNELTSLPELPKTLEYLYCADNQLTSLTELPKTLKYLDCENNQLPFTNLKEYKKWYKENKYLKRFEETEDKSQITSLDLSKQNLKELPDLSEYTNLEILYCHNNQLTSLPELPKTLKELDCYKNKLTSLPELPDTLKRLYCYNNQLTSLPELPKMLEKIYCSDNQLTSLPELPKMLEVLYCSYNQLPFEDIEEYKTWYEGNKILSKEKDYCTQSLNSNIIKQENIEGFNIPKRELTEEEKNRPITLERINQFHDECVDLLNTVPLSRNSELVFYGFLIAKHPDKSKDILKFANNNIHINSDFYVLFSENEDDCEYVKFYSLFAEFLNLTIGTKAHYNQILIQVCETYNKI